MRLVKPRNSDWRWMSTLVLLLTAFYSAAAGSTDSDALVARASQRTASFLDDFSEVRCTEQVVQEKLGKDEKIEVKQQSTYDYLVIFTNTDGELGLDESRLAIGDAAQDRKSRPLLITNGFATLVLVFHPYYSKSFEFSLTGDEVVGGQKLNKVEFHHLSGTRSPAALALRGREYPLELSGTAWIDPETGVVEKITAEVANTAEDVGLKSMRAEVQYAAVQFKGSKRTFWFPSRATVEVATPRQHWRNLHLFANYERFSVMTKEQVTEK